MERFHDISDRSHNQFPVTGYIGQVPGRGVFFGIPMSCSTRFSTPVRITPTKNAGRVTWGVTHNHLIVGYPV